MNQNERHVGSDILEAPVVEKPHSLSNEPFGSPEIARPSVLIYIRNEGDRPAEQINGLKETEVAIIEPEKIEPEKKSSDNRLLPRFVERVASRLFPYEARYVENIPKPPFIVAINHDVVRGRFIKTPYDALIINHFLWKIMGKSPVWLANVSPELSALRFFHKYPGGEAFTRRLLHIIFTQTTKCIQMPASGLSRAVLLQMVEELHRGGIVGICPTGSRKKTEIKPGIFYVAQTAKNEGLDVPIVPVRIIKISRDHESYSYLLDVAPPLFLSGGNEKLSLEEIELGKKYLQSTLYSSSPDL